MLRILWKIALKRLFNRRPIRKKLGHKQFLPTFEPLADRITPAIPASFLPGPGTLSVFGDALDNTITISRNAAGQILVNGGAVTVTGGTPTVANTALIQVSGLDGNDTITLDEANGALPAAQLFGGNGNDTLIGGSGADMLFGQAGNDTLLGKGGNDFLFGGADDDPLTGGDGDDQVFGESGNDRMIWNPGDDTDLNEGGDGIDTVEVNGGNGSEVFTATPNGTRVRFDRLDPAPFTIDIGTSENLVVNMNGGDDTFTGSNGLATLINLTVDGGAGNDTITGGDGDDLLLGGDGNDTIIGGRGNDTARMGAGDDTFVWNPGDGSDTVEGQDGIDTLQFNGANIDEKIDISANGQRVRFTRDVANIVMDLNDLEQVNFTAKGGVDTITVGDLSGTGLTQINLDLAGTPGTGTGDGAADSVTVNGTNAADNIQIVGAGTSYSVIGLPALINVTGSEGANDSLVVAALGGDDIVSASTLPADVVKLTIDGGTGNDTITGSAGADKLLGGDGNDLITGGKGDDSASLGAGDDTFVWNPGDGNDTVEGQDGTDRLLFNGANIDEKIDISANGSRVRFTRDIANIVMDLNGIERVDFTALGGIDTITVNDLSGTDLNDVRVNLTGLVGSGQGDSTADTVIVNGTAGADNIQISGSGTVATVTGLAARVSIFNTEGNLDQLVIKALGGDDTVSAAGLPVGVIGLTIDGGTGNDTITGSDGADQLVGGDGNDLITGGKGDDSASLGAGDDTFVWNPGDGNDTVEGQDGTDRLLFNGANIDEKIDISANGSRVRFFRDVANVTMDLNGVERVDFTALGGVDTVTVNDLSGTDLNDVRVNLTGLVGSGKGDSTADTVIVNGTAGADNIQVSGSGTVATVSGLAAKVSIFNTEGNLDQLVVNAQA